MLLLLHFLRLTEYLSNAPYSDSIVQVFGDNCFASPLILFSLLILVTLHRECLPRPSLPICEYRCVEAVHDLGDETFDLQLLEDLLLGVLGVNDLIEFEDLPHKLRAVFLRVLAHPEKY